MVTNDVLSGITLIRIKQYRRFFHPPLAPIGKDRLRLLLAFFHFIQPRASTGNHELYVVYVMKGVIVLLKSFGIMPVVTNWRFAARSFVFVSDWAPAAGPN
jgi:hypothetical protein